MRRILIVLLFLLPPPLLSQIGTIVGLVTDASTGDPIAGVSVVVTGTKNGASSALNGRYVIQRVLPGKHKVRATYVGYQSVSVADVLVNAGDTTRVDFRLPPASIQAECVQIVGASPQIQKDATYAVRLACTPQEFNTEEYSHIVDNGFLDALSNPLSTFSIDVDVASYSNVRRFLQGGSLPPADAVRTEEMINYFAYDYPQPTGNDPFSITTEMSRCPWNQEHQLLLIGLQGRRIPTASLPPANLVFLIDVSGSMDEPNKLPLVKASFRLLVDQLRPVDQVAIVVYAGTTGLVLPPTRGDQKSKILEAIDNLEAGGSTAGGAGLLLAYKTAHESFLTDGNNRIVWATDGDFNVGVSSTSELIRLVEDKRREGVSLSLLGFGMGNLKDSRLEQLADKGNGNYAYVDNFTEARRVLVGQMAGTLFTIAKDVKIQVEFNPLRVQGYRLIGYENRLLSKEDFNNDAKDAGELGSGHCVTALYELIPPGVAFTISRGDSLKYQATRLTPTASSSRDLMTVKLRYKPPADTTSILISKTLEDQSAAFERTSPNFRFASSVAEFAMLLRKSPYKEGSSFDALINRASHAFGRDPEGYRAEFVRLAASAKLLAASAKRTD